MPAAINNSIYLMLAVPYLSVGIVGYMIYRGVKKNQEYLKAHQGDDEPGGDPAP